MDGRWIESQKLENLTQDQPTVEAMFKFDLASSNLGFDKKWDITYMTKEARPLCPPLPLSPSPS